ncbi:biotin--[acetyl-CoA-carboxylase] ligase [Rhodovastum sp. RN2-1]|uniref:biotin--[biotin carboxyl-carrier protein] ligase n=1 Tax=Limobrevibacterium gyesilva TaxID=2991712 RepID=A0AA41YKU3_9PROT|nr:biotin--[acetyl-CoA-carboxylase] ligase [Limobrevibacterium gyesilva]MCW3475209.1 biotin--[acetyl-CoA-carboxylase] ligase [Limobrevibacterium gyesilva]
MDATGAWRLQVHDVLPSTSDLCRTLAEAGEPDGLAVLAHRQERGRGSHGRNWDSPAGNMYLSVLLRPPGRVREGGLWSLLAGLALAETVAPWLPDPAALTLKWPNDVLLGGRKLAGILLDSSADPQGALAWLVIGIGLNLAAAPQVPGRAVACIADVASAPRPEDAARALLARLDHWRRVHRQAGFAPVRAAWLARSLPVGAAMALRLGERDIGGSFAGLAEDGSLLLQTGGHVHAFAAGEVRLQLGR